MQVTSQLPLSLLLILFLRSDLISLRLMVRIIGFWWTACRRKRESITRSVFLVAPSSIIPQAGSQQISSISFQYESFFPIFFEKEYFFLFFLPILILIWSSSCAFIVYGFLLCHLDHMRIYLDFLDDCIPQASPHCSSKRKRKINKKKFQKKEKFCNLPVLFFSLAWDCCTVLAVCDWCDDVDDRLRPL